MPALHIEDLPEKEKLKMEVEQLRKEVKLQRQQVRGRSEPALSEGSRPALPALPPWPVVGSAQPSAEEEGSAQPGTRQLRSS